jgi:hypothetical protein
MRWVLADLRLTSKALFLLSFDTAINNELAQLNRFKNSI